MDKRTEELLGRVMAKAAIAADYTAKKTDEVVQATKLRYQLFETTHAIDAAERAIGRMVYAAHCGDAPDTAAMDAELAKLDELHASAQVLRQKRNAAKKTKLCPTCGKPCLQNDHYCASCGAEI